VSARVCRARRLPGPGALGLRVQHGRQRGRGVLQNALWSGYSVLRYRRTHRTWAVWPGIAVAWVMLAMGLELFDFAPLWHTLDAHSLWHAGTIAPTVLWYNFLIKDAQDDMAGTERLKA